MTEDIILRATGDTGDLEDSFEQAEDRVRRAMDGAQDAVEGLDVGEVVEAGEQIGESLGDGAERAGDAVADLGARLGELTQTAREAGDATAEMADAGDDLEDSATSAARSVHDLVDAQDTLTTAQRDAADASAKAADEARDTADAMDLVSTATKNAAAAGSEAGERIRAALEAIARSAGDVRDGVHAAELAFEQLGGSPSEFIGAANNDFERSAILVADLQKNIRQLDEESREGLGGFADRAAKVSQRMGELEDILERQGDQALPKIRDELERLRRQYRTTFDEGARRAANLEAEIEQQEDALKRMKLEARGSG